MSLFVTYLLSCTYYVRLKNLNNILLLQTTTCVRIESETSKYVQTGPQNNVKDGAETSSVPVEDQNVDHPCRGIRGHNPRHGKVRSLLARDNVGIAIGEHNIGHSCQLATSSSPVYYRAGGAQPRGVLGKEDGGIDMLSHRQRLQLEGRLVLLRSQ